MYYEVEWFEGAGHDGVGDRQVDEVHTEGRSQSSALVKQTEDGQVGQDPSDNGEECETGRETPAASRKRSSRLLIFFCWCSVVFSRKRTCR